MLGDASVVEQPEYSGERSGEVALQDRLPNHEHSNVRGWKFLKHVFECGGPPHADGSGR